MIEELGRQIGTFCIPQNLIVQCGMPTEDTRWNKMKETGALPSISKLQDKIRAIGTEKS